MHSIKQKLKYILQWTVQVPRLLPKFRFIQNYSEDWKVGDLVNITSSEMLHHFV